MTNNVVQESEMSPRNTLLARLRSGEMDDLPLIIGGGVNGLGVFRDLALQGVTALLVDRADFSSGTSAAPSRLIHGGLRYLETGEFALVRESVIERNALLRNAPHQVTPLSVWVPAYSWLGGLVLAGLRFFRLVKDPGPKGALMIKLGLLIFDGFGKANRVMPGHRLVRASEARRRFPRLRKRLAAVLEYYDARLSSPERLALELVKDAEADCPGALAIPHLEVTGLEEGKVVLMDRVDGEVFTVAPSIVINCAGPWVDTVDAPLGVPKPLMGGTKGSHLVLDRPDLAEQLGDGMIYFETADHRACLVYRLDGGMVLLGTTDIRTRDPDDRCCSEAEIDYLFGVLEDLMPGVALHRDQIRFTFAGVRPLPAAKSGSTGAISRDHAIEIFPPTSHRPFPLHALVGGKWTTYRSCSEQISDGVLRQLGVERRASTLHLPIGGGRNYPMDEEAWEALIGRIAAAGHVDIDTATRLLRRYGTTALDLAAGLTGDGRVSLAEAPCYLRGEIDWIARNERVTRLDDVILRRTLLAFEGLVTRDLVDEIAMLVEPVLNWSPDRRRDEIARTMRILSERHHLTVLDAYDGSERERDLQWRAGQGPGSTPRTAARIDTPLGADEI
jgi:glycerol-3-phosphate dehydrogenase